MKRYLVILQLRAEPASQAGKAPPLHTERQIISLNAAGAGLKARREAMHAMTLDAYYDTR